MKLPPEILALPAKVDIWIHKADQQFTVFKDAERAALLQGIGYGMLGMLTLFAIVAFTAWIFNRRAK